jgi:retron-type reverse transcriptase
MARMKQEIGDKRVLKLINAYLKSGVMINGVVVETEQGTPQGGPLSPLLSNIVLTELDRKLEERGHRFVRYADDCTIYVKSKRAGERVLENTQRYLEKRMRLKVNQAKSGVDLATRRGLLGFSFY